MEQQPAPALIRQAIARFAEQHLRQGRFVVPLVQQIIAPVERQLVGLDARCDTEGRVRRSTVIVTAGHMPVQEIDDASSSRAFVFSGYAAAGEANQPVSHGFTSLPTFSDNLRRTRASGSNFNANAFERWKAPSGYVRPRSQSPHAGEVAPGSLLHRPG